jgi:hypothetical protein
MNLAQSFKPIEVSARLAWSAHWQVHVNLLMSCTYHMNGIALSNLTATKSPKLRYISMELAFGN